MSQSRFAIIIFVNFFGLLAFAENAQLAKDKLFEASSYFNKGQYQKALSVLRDVDIRRDFDNSDDMKLAFKIRAVCYDGIGDHEASTETIREILFLDPAYSFDPFDTPAAVM
jgi:Tfp pilus assembly protein PilF